MLNKRKSKLHPKSKQTRAPCLCGCGATSPSTIAAHRKEFAREAKIRSLNTARAAVPTVSLVTPRRRSGQEPAVPLPSAPTGEGEHENVGPSTEDLMDVDPDPPRLHEPSEIPRSRSPINRVWTSRVDRPGREDEDLVSDPGSPEVSEDEDGEDGEMRSGEEPAFLTDDEDQGVARVEISARDRLTANYQLSAARAGMFFIVAAH